MYQSLLKKTITFKDDFRDDLWIIYQIEWYQNNVIIILFLGIADRHEAILF